jgi:hypothetical protein
LAQDALDRVRQNIRERLEELESERDQLLRALEALSSGSSPLRRRGRPPGPAKGGATSGNGRRRGGGKRAARGQRRQQVLDALEGRELGPSGIAREIGDVNPTQISGLLRQLAAEGKVARTAGGKWQLTAASEHESQAAAAPPPEAPRE